jgi:hypothetical protein
MLTQDNQSKNQPQSLNAKDVNGQTKPVPLEDLLEDLTSNPQPDKQKNGDRYRCVPKQHCWQYCLVQFLW